MNINKCEKCGGEIENYAHHSFHRCTPNVPTLLDQFAMAALTGLLVGRKRLMSTDQVVQLCEDSFGIALEMYRQKKIMDERDIDKNL